MNGRHADPHAQRLPPRAEGEGYTYSGSAFRAVHPVGSDSISGAGGPPWCGRSWPWSSGESSFGSCGATSTPRTWKSWSFAISCRCCVGKSAAPGFVGATGSSSPPHAAAGCERRRRAFLVTPQTALRWHRELVRVKRSRRIRRQPGRPPLDEATQGLILSRVSATAIRTFAPSPGPGARPHATAVARDLSDRHERGLCNLHRGGLSGVSRSLQGVQPKSWDPTFARPRLLASPGLT